jgi:hypothetical protein
LLPVLVPPWNRIAQKLVPTLSEIGFAGLSTFGPRRRARPAPRLVQVNTHLDLIDWKGGRVFPGERIVLEQLVRALHLCADAEEPLGVLSHHLAMDGAAWDFLEKLWHRIAEASGGVISPARELFACREARV